MHQYLHRYRFVRSIDMTEVEAAFLLAISAIESLHGEARVRLDARHFLDGEKQTCVIDAGTSVGQNLNRLFIGFLIREFGPDAFTVERISERAPSPAT